MEFDFRRVTIQVKPKNTIFLRVLRTLFIHAFTIYSKYGAKTKKNTKIKTLQLAHINTNGKSFAILV